MHSRANGGQGSAGSQGPVATLPHTRTLSVGIADLPSSIGRDVLNGLRSGGNRIRGPPAVCLQTLRDGTFGSSTFLALSAPLTGNPSGSRRPICTSTLAWSQ